MRLRSSGGRACAASMAMARATGRARPPGGPGAGRVLEVAQRIGSMMLRPAAADQQRSIRASSSTATWLMSLGRKPSPRRRSPRPRSSGDQRRRGVSSIAIRMAESTVRAARDPLDTSAEQELHGGPTLQVERLGDHGRSRGFEVGLGGLAAPPGVGQGLAQLGAERALGPSPGDSMARR